MAEEETKPKRKSLIILLAFIVLLAASGIGAGAWYYLSDKEEVEPQPEYEPLDPSEILVAAIHPMNPFTVNLKDKTFLRFSMAIKFKTEKIPNIFYSKEYEIRDRIISLLNQKVSEQLVNPESRNVLKNEILAILRTSINSDEVEDVYFVDLIVQ